MSFSNLPIATAAQTKKTELLLGRSESARFRKAFDKADNSRRGKLTVAEAARAYGSLGGKATETEVIIKVSGSITDTLRKQH